MQKPRRFVILVHGVGLPTTGLFGNKLEERLKEHLAVTEPISFNWHDFMHLPITVENKRFGMLALNLNHFSLLARGLLGSSARFDVRVPRLSRLLHIALFSIILLAPLAFWMTLICLPEACSTLLLAFLAVVGAIALWRV